MLDFIKILKEVIDMKSIERMLKETDAIPTCDFGYLAGMVLSLVLGCVSMFSMIPLTMFMPTLSQGK